MIARRIRVAHATSTEPRAWRTIAARTTVSTHARVWLIGARSFGGGSRSRHGPTRDTRVRSGAPHHTLDEHSCVGVRVSVPGSGCRVLVGRARRRDPATLDTPTASSQQATRRRVCDHVGRSARRGASPHALSSPVTRELPRLSVGLASLLWRCIPSSRASRASSSSARVRCATRAQTEVFESRGHDQPLTDANG
jgi:hypothetical protein